MYMYEVVQISRRGFTSPVAYHGTDVEAEMQVERLNNDPTLNSEFTYKMMENRVQIATLEEEDGED